MVILRVWIPVVLLVLAHLLLHVGLGLGREVPNLMTIGLLLAARELRVGAAAALGLFLGVLEDSLTVVAFGAHAVAMTSLAILGALTRDLFVGDSKRFVLSYFFVGTLLRDVVLWIMMGEALRQPFVQEVVIHGGLGAMYAAVVGLGLVAVTGLAGRV